MSPGAGTAMLSADRLAAVRGRQTLFTDLSFELPSGKLLLLRGPNGSGKTTLMRTLAGLVTPSQGRVLWNGRPIETAPEDFRSALLYLGHLPAVSELMSVRENLQSWIDLDGEKAAPADIDRALEGVGLRSRRNLPARALSQGQRRRIGLARLLLSGRELWLLDEPMTALDTAGVALLGTRLDQHLRSGGSAVVATHQPLPVDDKGAREIVLG